MSNRLTQRDPLLAELDAMSEQFDRMFGVRSASGGPRGFLPATDVYETENEVVIELDVPGVHPENLSAEVVDGQLIVTGDARAVRGRGAPLSQRALAGPLRPHVQRASWRRRLGDRCALRRRRAASDAPKAEDAKPRSITINHSPAIESAGA